MLEKVDQAASISGGRMVSQWMVHKESLIEEKSAK